MLSELIVEFEPQGVAVEIRFTALNMKTALRLAEVRGVVLLVRASHNVSCAAIHARSEGLRPGYGHAGKEQMQLMVRALLA